MSGIKHTHKLKNLHSQKTRLELQVKSLDEERRETARKYDESLKKLKMVESQIEQHHTKEISVTEHALLRYFERVLGFDLEEIKEKILSEELEEHIDTLVSGKFPIGDGKYAVVKNRVVITIE